MYRIPGFSMTPQQIKNTQSETKQEPLEQTQYVQGMRTQTDTCLTEKAQWTLMKVRVFSHLQFVYSGPN